MLMQPTLEALSDMRLAGLRRALEEQLAGPKDAQLSFEEPIDLLVDQEWTRRQHTRLQRRLLHGSFRHRASIDHVGFAPDGGLDRRLLLQLATGEWIVRHLNVIVTGPTGVGKTYLACALGRAACQAGFVVGYERLNGLLHRIRQAHGEGAWPDLLLSLVRIQLLVVDDWLRDPITAVQARDLAEILQNRYQVASTLLATQVPIGEWHSRMGDQDAAAPILDRLIHGLPYRRERRVPAQVALTAPQFEHFGGLTMSHRRYAPPTARIPRNECSNSSECASQPSRGCQFVPACLCQQPTIDDRAPARVRHVIYDRPPFQFASQAQERRGVSVVQEHLRRPRGAFVFEA